MKEVHVIGAGLAGCECAYYLARHGVQVVLYEMKPEKRSPAHQSDGFAELVCSNSLKAKRPGSAAGMLKREMEALGSLVVEAAYVTEVSAGGALAVDRDKFSEYITEKVQAHPNIEIRYGEVTELPYDVLTVIATGPLTSDGLSKALSVLVGGENLSFYDAAAPIVTFDSLDKEKVFFAARYDRGEADYINCPFTKEEYEAFIAALVTAEGAPLSEVDKETFKVYEGCMPVEVLAKRGPDTLRFGPMKPVGLTDPKTDRRPYAVVQLRAENREKTLYNLVGFQTNLKFGEQKRVFSMIPGLATAEFMRYGVMHRNSFIDSPRLLAEDLSLGGAENIFFAGQITGVEGYTESAMSGIFAGVQILRRLQEKEAIIFPRETMMGALLHYVTDVYVNDFQPMGANMGILPPLPEKIKGKQERYEALSDRGFLALEQFLLAQEISR